MLRYLLEHNIDQRHEAEMTSFCSLPDNYLIVLTFVFCSKLDSTY